MSRWLLLLFAWTGFAGAISVALALFLCYIDCSDDQRTQASPAPPDSTGGRASLALTASLLGLACIAGLPAAASAGPSDHHLSLLSFPQLLFILHVVLLVPLLAAPSPSSARAALHTLGIASLLYRGWITARLLQTVSPATLPTILLAAAFAHDCQASITRDAVFVAVICTAHAALHRRYADALVLLLTSPIVSIGTTMSLYFADE